ncbi:sigma 54-interacting transcriptional regulator [Neorhizobium sp. T25_13]|uniref:sigma-54-dependent Fis family transcriptional regulator n=1 Tax=Neorhizobium sp. T25_13 TaxID=2093830 RepID=UPI000CF8DFC6|nr:sigma 54-interacting transcriptional regulator [Neorhizobium sp. T25_13]
MSNETIYEDLLDLTTALAKERRVEALLVHVLEAALRLSNAEGAAIFTLDRLARHLHRVCFNYRGVTSSNQADSRIALYDKSLTPNLRDPATFAVTTATMVNVADIDNAPGFDFSAIREMDRTIGFRSRSLVIMPLFVDGEETIGTLQLVNVRERGGGLSKTLVRPLQGLAAHAAAAIRNARLFEENQRLIKQLGRMNEELLQENTRLLSKAKPKSSKPKGLIGNSPPIEKVFDLIERAAGSSVPILLLGETGTGKEMMANYIHLSSARAERSFIAQNCAALPESLLESELFGHVRGAFTGAVGNKAGLAHEAHGGTLFLDEVGDMPLGLQAKVLRLLQEGEVRRVGSTKTEHVDVRIVAATNANLEEKIDRGEFRKDLYYRLNVFPIIVPPLRERPSDIPGLIDHFLKDAVGNREVPPLSSEALNALLRWSYPGNVRELKNILERAVLLANRGQSIGPQHLPPEIGGFREQQSSRLPGFIPDGDLKTIVGLYEALVIETKLREVNWNQSHAARNLKVSRRTIVEKLNRYDIRRPGTPMRNGFERAEN